MNALIAIYGANNETNSGNDIYQLSTLYNDRSHYTIWDAGGVDTIDLSQINTIRIDLRDNRILVWIIPSVPRARGLEPKGGFFH